MKPVLSKFSLEITYSHAADTILIQGSKFFAAMDVDKKKSRLRRRRHIFSSISDKPLPGFFLTLSFPSFEGMLQRTFSIWRKFTCLMEIAKECVTN